MTSSPYQSNLLRFFVRQYRQGMNRHRLAVQKTRSSIALSGELGVVIAITPAYALLRAAQNMSEKAGKALQRAADKLKLPATGYKTSKLAELLDFSGFVSLSLMQMNEEQGGDKDQASKNIATPELGPADLSECGTDNRSLMTSEVMMAEVLITAGESLRAKQRRQIAGQLSWWQSWTAKAATYLAESFRVRSPNSICFSSADAITSENLSFKQAISKDLLSTQPQKITGLASDIATKSLVLVLGNLTVWNGLSSEQQKRIQDKIHSLLPVSSSLPLLPAAERLLLVPDGKLNRRPEAWLGVSQAKTSQIVSKTSRALSVIGYDLMRPVHSFWVAVLQVMNDWFQQDAAPLCPKSLASASLKLPVLSFLLPKTADNFLDSHCLTPGRIKYALTSTPRMSAMHHTSQHTVSNRTTRTSNYLDATVISVDYIEHPLEKMLKWVDRFLVWIENGWQRLLNWLRC